MKHALANNKKGVVGKRGRITPIRPRISDVNPATNQNTLRVKCKLASKESKS
ncbi:hypothetical protein [Aliivibrio fischeri]|uniref:hypothetical protein n=1 Tax=Aliivibrio fischeri TaxID=668 RepID=UPI001F195965|nr:hypothetical protein [Aliivibrio fischeri]